MPENRKSLILLIAALLLVCLVAGLLGGIDFAPDVALIHSLESLRVQSPRLTLALIGVTHVGSAYGIIGIGLAVTAWLAWRREYWPAIVLGTTVIGERLIVDGAKLLIDRNRPAFDFHPVVTHSSSFPSGHSGNSMAVLLAIALIAVPAAQRVPAVIAAIGASLLIGSTRPYLGVHWPSDVIGGWSLGAAIALIAWMVAETRSSAAAEQQHEIIRRHVAPIDQ